MDPRLKKLAQVIVQYCARVVPGDLVLIRAEPHSTPAVEAVFEQVLLAGGHPSFSARSDRLMELLLQHGNQGQLQHACPFESHQFATCDVLIVLRQPLNTRFLSQADPVKAAMAKAARRSGPSVSAKPRGQRYVLSEIPGHAAAQEAQMSLADYEDFVYTAGMLHLPDPAAAWQRLYEQNQRVIDYLHGKRILRFQSPPGIGNNDRRHDGTDLTLDMSDRIWLNRADGENFPDGELDSGPRTASGVVNFTMPALFNGKEVDGIRLKFKDAKVTEASATKNQDYLIALLDSDPGASIIGEIGIGTNYHLKQPINNTFFDEKIGGTFHLALGAGYPQTGNTNQSGIHWDIVSDLRQGGSISADGQTFQQNGKFLFPGWPGNA